MNVGRPNRMTGGPQQPTARTQLTVSDQVSVELEAIEKTLVALYLHYSATFVCLWALFLFFTFPARRVCVEGSIMCVKQKRMI